MALQKTITGNYGDTVKDSYIRIDDVSGGKNGLIVRVNAYTNDKCDYFVRELRPIEGLYSFVPDVSDNAGNFLKQGYEHLKSLLDFEGALNV